MRTQASRILSILQLAGERGVPNWKLAEVGLQYNARIFDLRKKGYDIRKRRLYAEDEATEVYYYYLAEKPADRLEKPQKPVDDAELEQAMLL